MAVASAGPYAKHLHLAADTIHNHASTHPMLVASEKLPIQVSLHYYARQYAACDVFPARWLKCV